MRPATRWTIIGLVSVMTFCLGSCIGVSTAIYQWYQWRYDRSDDMNVHEEFDENGKLINRKIWKGKR